MRASSATGRISSALPRPYRPFLAAPLEHVLGQHRQVAAPGQDRAQPVRQRSPGQVTHQDSGHFRQANKPPAGGSRPSTAEAAARPGRRSASTSAPTAFARRATCSACRLRSEAGNRRQAPEFAAHRGVGEACLQALRQAAHRPRAGGGRPPGVGQALGQGRLVASGKRMPTPPPLRGRRHRRWRRSAVRRRPWLSRIMPNSSVELRRASTPSSAVPLRPGRGTAHARPLPSSQARSPSCSSRRPLPRSPAGCSWQARQRGSEAAQQR